VLRNGRRALPRALTGRMRGRLRRALGELAITIERTATVAATAQAGREWDRWEIRDAWAAGLWVRLIYAKQEAAEGGSQQLDRLTTEIDERLDHAALR
jgi:hypothetical protein